MRALTYAWDFGDGSTGSGVSPQHTYAAGGTYTVTLTVTDRPSAPDSEVGSVTVERPAERAADGGVHLDGVEPDGVLRRLHVERSRGWGADLRVGLR